VPTTSLTSDRPGQSVTQNPTCALRDCPRAGHRDKPWQAGAAGFDPKGKANPGETAERAPRHHHRGHMAGTECRHEWLIPASLGISVTTLDLRFHNPAGKTGIADLGWQPRGQGFDSPWVHKQQVRGPFGFPRKAARRWSVYPEADLLARPFSPSPSRCWALRTACFQGSGVRDATAATNSDGAVTTRRRA